LGLFKYWPNRAVRVESRFKWSLRVINGVIGIWESAESHITISRRWKHRHWLATIFYRDGERFARAETVRKKAIAFTERQRKYSRFKGHHLFTRIPAGQN